MRHRTQGLPALVVLAMLASGAVAAAQAGGAEAVRYSAGVLPEMPAMVAGGGQVVLQVAVKPSGSVGTVTTLRDTPPYTELLRRAVAAWRFTPVVASDSPEGANVLVVGVFRPPTMYEPAPGEVPRDLAKAAADVPFPKTLAPPPLPPREWTGGVVLAELQVGPDGEVTDAAVVRTEPAAASGTSAAALEAVKSWRFRPAVRKGEPASSVVYAVLGFASPVVSGPESPTKP